MTKGRTSLDQAISNCMVPLAADSEEESLQGCIMEPDFNAANDHMKRFVKVSTSIVIS